MERKKVGHEIAYCVPTYNRSDVVEDVLSRCIQLYKKYNLDIYFYDSSTDDRTHDVVQYFIDNGYDNLYYIRMDSSISVDEKTLKLLAGYGLEHSYKYIWPVKDRVFVGEETLRAVLGEIDEGYDAYFFSVISDPLDDEQKRQPLPYYDNAVDFYAQCGWAATSLDVIMFNVQTLLEDIDWEEYKERYFFEGENAFDHYTVLFHSLAQLEKCSVRVIMGEDIAWYSSVLGKSTWKKRIFRILADLWVRLNYALPSCYDEYKEETIKRAVTLPIMLGSHDRLINLKLEGILDFDVYGQICQRWALISDIPIKELELIVGGQFGELYYRVRARIEKLIQAGQYWKAHVLYYTNLWMKSLKNDKDYAVLGECFRTAWEEKEDGVETGIFYGAKDSRTVIWKYITLKHLLRRIEYRISMETWEEIARFIWDNHISGSFINYMVDKCCMDKIAVTDRLLRLFEE